VLVREGERVPVDGTLAEGECAVDEAVVTGESLPVTKREGDDVVGGSVVTTDAAVVDIGERTTSSIDRLTRIVWNVQSADHGVTRRGDELAATVVPIVLAAAVVVVGAGSLVSGASGLSVALAALMTLMVASPWALGFATSYSVASSLEAALERGIVVFDETIFERLRAIDVVVFDKTGTLTTGEMSVLEADAPDDLLAAAAALEQQRAAHPAAAAIADAFDGSGGDGAAIATTAMRAGRLARTAAQLRRVTERSVTSTPTRPASREPSTVERCWSAIPTSSGSEAGRSVRRSRRDSSALERRVGSRSSSAETGRRKGS